MQTICHLILVAAYALISVTYFVIFASHGDPEDSPQIHEQVATQASQPE